jgi:hypothetical protein
MEVLDRRVYEAEFIPNTLLVIGTSAARSRRRCQTLLVLVV